MLYQKTTEVDKIAKEDSKVTVTVSRLIVNSKPDYYPDTLVFI